MWYAVSIILILIVCFLMLRLRFRVELSDQRRVMFMGLGRSGIQVDFAQDVTRIKLWGFAIRTISRRRPPTGAAKAVTIKPTPLKTEKRGIRKYRRGFRAPLHLREWVDVGLKSLRAVRLYLVDLLRAVIVEEAEAEVRGGFESPHLTGEVYGYYHALIGAVPSLAPRLRFEPDWTGQSFSGTARLSLAMPVYALLYRTLVLIFRLPLFRIQRLVREQKKGALYA
ncbi:hypothetical protein C3F09_08355 [candidate division GN15 bacterium]|uniref:DUF2953 domain-containing protein n=1 Tax=candidate division GN15 bacterium TaxID=2072418 RepID=A0A855X4D7_9BACT|nr:MAG: hypothetical protein C3F09_08355 [candidate division GN15 bacterium]